jgi:SPP1 family predicted phage head-tail adaptor
MRAGKLRHRVTFERPDVVRNSYGEEETTWVVAATLWASVEPISGRELLQSNRETAEGTIRVRVRVNPDIAAMTPKWRLGFRGRIYNVEHIRNPEMLGGEFEIMVREDVTGG